MTLRQLLIAATFATLSATAVAHDPTLFGGEPHSAKTTPTTCEELDETKAADLDTRDPDVKALQAKCEADDVTKDAADKTQAESDEEAKD
jgi:hypothetical protein